MGHPLLTRATFPALLVAALCALGGGAALGADVYVVANDVALSPGDIREVYLGDKEFSGTLRLVPVDNVSLQGQFLARVLSLSEPRYAALWVRKAFRDALNPPLLKASDAEVISFVKQTRGAIGYVGSVPRDPDLHVLGKY
jgi:hypothetical protein